MQNDFDICNLALLRIGQRQYITSLTDGSPNATICNTLYAHLRDRLLRRTMWGFAERQALLVDTGLIPSPNADALTIPGWTYKYALPADCLKARYVFNGVRPGRPAVPNIDPADLLGIDVTQVAMLPPINGAAPQIPFKTVGSLGGSLFTDYGESIDAWDATISYEAGAVVVGPTDGLVYVASGTSGIAGHAPPNGTYWTVATNAQVQAHLVYTAQITDVTKFSEDFIEALAWLLAVDLSLSLATKPQLASLARQEANAALMKAVVDEADGEQADIQPDSSFITVRN